MQDEAEDWGRWRDVVFRAKAALSPHGVTIPLPPQNRRKRGGPALDSLPRGSADESIPLPPSSTVLDGPAERSLTQEKPTNQLTTEDVVKLAARSSITPSDKPTPDPTPPPVAAPSAPVTADPVTDENGMYYCPECFVPLHPDPKPESLYIFLHALKYTTSLGTFETGMPEWAAEGWEWER